MLTAREVKPASNQSPKQLIVFLHGYGADGNDLIDLSEEFAPFFPDAQFLSPNAPEPCEMSPYGFQWFGLMDRREEIMLAGAKNAAPLLNGFLDASLARFNLADSQMALVGFSQGTMMALYTALRRPHPCAAIAGFSGALVGESVLAGQITARPPVLLVHGDADQVVPFAAMGQAKIALTQNNVPVETFSRRNLGHGIDMQGLEKTIEFLRANLL